MKAVKQQDKKATNKLLTLVYPQLRKVSKKEISDKGCRVEGDSEDILQDVLLLVWDKLRTKQLSYVKHMGHFIQFFRTAIRFNALKLRERYLNRYDSMSNHGYDSDGEYICADDIMFEAQMFTTDYESQLIEATQSNHIAKALNSLTPEKRTLLTWCVVDELPLSEVEKRTLLNRQTINQALTQIKLEFRNYLTPKRNISFL